MYPNQSRRSVLKFISYAVLLLGLLVYTYMQRYSPRQPDPATGHTLPVVSPRSPRRPRHILYLTGAERTIYHASFAAIVVGMLGVFGQMLMSRQHSRAN